MTQPVQEPTQGRKDQAQEFRTRQLFRRPASSALEWEADGTPVAGPTIPRATLTVANFDFDNYAEVPYNSIDATDDGSVFALAANRLRIKKGGMYLFDIGFRGFVLQASVNTMVDFAVVLVATAPTHFWSNSLTGVTGPSYQGLMRIDQTGIDVEGYAYPGVRGFIDISTNAALANDAVFKVTANWTEDGASVATNIVTNWLSVIRLGDTAWGA